MTVHVHRTRGNVFRDLGFDRETAANLKIRSDLMTRLIRVIRARGLTQSRAAKLLGVTQPRVSDLVRGRIDRFSVDTLITMLSRTGASVRVVVTNARHVA